MKINLIGQYAITNSIDGISTGIYNSNKIKAAGEARQLLNDLFDRKIIRQGVYEREMFGIAKTLGLNLKES